MKKDIIMEKYIISATSKDLAQDLISSLGAFRIDNGDRVSDYFELAHDEKDDRMVTVSLTENANNLDTGNPYYSVHIIDDISGDNCDLRLTDTLDTDELVKLLDEIIQDFISLDEQNQRTELVKRLLFWANYEYKKTPLAFLKLPRKLTSEEEVTVLKLFDRWYGDTDQDTPNWATEYQLLARMLLHSSALLVNPKYLAMDELGEDIGILMLTIGEKNAEWYEAACAIAQDELNQMYQDTLLKQGN